MKVKDKRSWWGAFSTLCCINFLPGRYVTRLSWLDHASGFRVLKKYAPMILILALITSGVIAASDRGPRGDDDPSDRPTNASVPVGLILVLLLATWLTMYSLSERAYTFPVGRHVRPLVLTALFWVIWRILCLHTTPRAATATAYAGPVVLAGGKIMEIVIEQVRGAVAKDPVKAEPKSVLAGCQDLIRDFQEILLDNSAGDYRKERLSDLKPLVDSAPRTDRPVLTRLLKDLEQLLVTHFNKIHSKRHEILKKLDRTIPGLCGRKAIEPRRGVAERPDDAPTIDDHVLTIYDIRQAVAGGH